MIAESMIDKMDGTGTPVDVVLDKIPVAGDKDALREQLLKAIKADRTLKSIVTTHRGSLNRLVEHFGGNRDRALKFMALGVHAGVWEIQSAQQMLRQPREKAVEMAGKGFLYVKVLDTL